MFQNITTLQWAQALYIVAYIIFSITACTIIIYNDWRSFKRTMIDFLGWIFTIIIAIALGPLLVIGWIYQEREYVWNLPTFECGFGRNKKFHAYIIFNQFGKGITRAYGWLLIRPGLEEMNVWTKVDGFEWYRTVVTSSSTSRKK